MTIFQRRKFHTQINNTGKLLRKREPKVLPKHLWSNSVDTSTRVERTGENRNITAGKSKLSMVYSKACSVWTRDTLHKEE